MTYRSRGDLCNLCCTNETTYGQPNTGNVPYEGTLLTIKDSDSETRTNYWKCGQRTPAGNKLTAISSGYSATFNVVAGQGVTKKWFTKAGVGALNTYAPIGSHTAVIKVADSEYHAFLGSSVDTFKMSASELGGFVEYSVDCKSQFHTFATSTNSLVHPDGTTVNALTLTATPDGAPVVNTSYWTYKDDSNVDRPVPATSWTLTVGNGLQSHAALDKDNDTTAIRLEDGLQPTAGELSVQLELTFPSYDSEWDLMKLAHKTISYIELDIDGITITLRDCTIDPSGPSRTSAGNYDETVTLTARTIDIADLTVNNG